MNASAVVTTEQARELSRMNNRLYECVMPDEGQAPAGQVVSHVIIKADVRGSTRMTQDLLSRGLNPASHFSLNFAMNLSRNFWTVTRQKSLIGRRRHHSRHF